jgi:hypothetical protein
MSEDLKTTDSPTGADSLDRIVGHHFGCKEHDALWVALHAAAIEEMDPQGDHQVTDIVYDWLREETRHRIVYAIVRELRKRGFHILPNVRDHRCSPEASATNTKD